MIMAIKKRKDAVIIPSDMFFYIIPLIPSRQRLTREDLATHYEPPKGRKAYMGNHYKLISFENSILTVQVHPSDGSENHLYLHVELDELHVACTCGMPDDKLCYHAFIGLHSMCWLTEGFNFQEIYWPGYYDSAKAKKFLEIELGKERINISANPDFGTLYRSGLKFPDDQPPALSNPTDRVLTLKPGETAVYSYALCFATGRFRNRHFPLLLPFFGITSKDGSKVVSFTKFILPDKLPVKSNGHQLQQQLDSYSKTLYGIVRPLSLAENRDWTAWDSTKHIVFKMWQEILPLLIDYPYNQSYHLYWLKYLRERPMKTLMQGCRYSLERPSLTFNLTYHKHYFTLMVDIIIGSKAIKVEHKPHLFVFDEETNTCFLMNTLQDDELLIWMTDNNNKITILAEHFHEFDKDFLRQLSDKYSVFFSERSGKRIAYDCNLVKSITGV
ncbi:hypothetical protein CKK33_10600 [Mucilaginibacter sp. MD40]|nr:hypothetical protein CKK33_10600 [Mucilaginibacter sp. MD40]